MMPGKYEDKDELLAKMLLAMLTLDTDEYKADDEKHGIAVPA